MQSVQFDFGCGVLFVVMGNEFGEGVESIEVCIWMVLIINGFGFKMCAIG